MFNLFFIFMIFNAYKLNATNIPIVMTDSNVILDLEWGGKETRTSLVILYFHCMPVSNITKSVLARAPSWLSTSYVIQPWKSPICMNPKSP